MFSTTNEKNSSRIRNYAMNIIREGGWEIETIPSTMDLETLLTYS